MTEEQILIYKRIDEILWFDWDPIGVNQIEEARDEYQQLPSTGIQFKN